MKYAQVPNIVEVIDIVTKQSLGLFPLEQYAMIFWLNSPKWQTPITNIASLIKVMEEFKKAPGEWMAFEDADYKILVPIIKEPDVNNGKVNLPLPQIYLQLRHYEDVILEASDALKGELPRP
jgi:hypothetical protein